MQVGLWPTVQAKPQLLPIGSCNEVIGTLMNSQPCSWYLELKCGASLGPRIVHPKFELN